MNKTLEIEVKIASGDLHRITSAGFELNLLKPRYFEDNWLLDFPDESLRRNGAALRVRAVNGRGLITYKGLVSQSASSPLKIREEIETEVGEPDLLVELFERLGFRRTFRYQKYRTLYSLELEGRHVEVSLDETPIGTFIEIEGDEKAVLRAIEATGFSAELIIRDSYPEIQAARCKARGVPMEDLIFRQ
jgi:predicted adenylyl cyclase CyaB